MIVTLNPTPKSCKAKINFSLKINYKVQIRSEHFALFGDNGAFG